MEGIIVRMGIMKLSIGQTPKKRFHRTRHNLPLFEVVTTVS